MNLHEIDALEAGRELDVYLYQALLNEELSTLNCRHVNGDIQPHAGYPLGHVSPPHRSTNIEDAWRLAELMSLRNFDVQIELYGNQVVEVTVAWFNSEDCPGKSVSRAKSLALGRSLPLALSRASLKALVLTSPIKPPTPR